MYEADNITCGTGGGPCIGWQLDVHESVLIEILNSTQVRHLDVFIDFLISHSNAHLSYTRNDKD